MVKKCDIKELSFNSETSMVYSAQTLYPKVLVYWSATPILLTKADDTGCAYASRTIMENILTHLDVDVDEWWEWHARHEGG